MLDARGLRLWFAEDDDADWHLVKRSLKKCVSNAIIRRAIDGQAMLEMLEEALESNAPLPNLILLDINMPRMSGLDLLKLIKNDERLRSIPVLVLTTSQIDAAICYDFGVNTFYTKPFDTREAFRLFEVIWTHWIDAAVHRAI